MRYEDLIPILSIAERLKCNTRHSDTSSGRRESVAEHSWRLKLMAMLLEYDLQLTYGAEEVAFSPYTAGLKEYINNWTREKIEKSKQGEYIC